MINFRKLIICITLLILTLYIPLSYTVYSESWYKFNYNKQDITYKYITQETVNNATNNLISYFLFKEKLNDNFDEKEQKHFNDVRNIYVTLFILSIISLFLLIRVFNLKSILISTKINLAVISIFTIIILTSFNFFWNKIFHPLLFNNNYWITTPNQISFYLFPNEFFINSIILIIITSAILNIIIYIITKYYLTKTP